MMVILSRVVLGGSMEESGDCSLLDRVGDCGGGEVRVREIAAGSIE